MGIKYVLKNWMNGYGLNLNLKKNWYRWNVRDDDESWSSLHLDGLWKDWDGYPPTTTTTNIKWRWFRKEKMKWKILKFVWCCGHVHETPSRDHHHHQHMNKEINEWKREKRKLKILKFDDRGHRYGINNNNTHLIYD